MGEGVLKRTPLHAKHMAMGARMVPFAGYEMPVQFPAGVLREHLHTREAAGLFDVSHMGQALVVPRGGDPGAVMAAFEALVPQAVTGLPQGRQRYGFFTNEAGGIRDDMMFANLGEALFVVVNAACKEADFALMSAGLAGVAELRVLDRALLALQGPKAEAVLARLNPDVRMLRFMDVRRMRFDASEAIVARAGYTGEDGFEISLPAAEAVDFAERLMAQPEVLPVGLGARDSLRLEAGLCLYGHDIDATTSPVEAGLDWAIQPARRTGGARAGGFPGAERILRELDGGPALRRVGLRPEGRAPMREGTELFAAETEADPVGRITSGGFGPSVDAPVAMGYVPAALAAPGTRLFGLLRGKKLPVTVAPLPFIAPRYKRA
jgi:aminomethyltransferase